MGNDPTIKLMTEQKIMPRIWAHDHTVWRSDPTEIVDRLDWLSIADQIEEKIPEIQTLINGVRQDGYTHALLMGMGGSSLSAEVFRSTFGVKEGFLNLSVLDSTDPAAVLKFTRTLDPHKTLYLVSTKSGGTVETFSYMRYFFNQVLEEMDIQEVGQHFIAITDPNSKLEEAAKQYNFRHIFLNNPNIGGRYSALSYYGLVPAALMGVDLNELLVHAHQAMHECSPSINLSRNPAAQLGSKIGEYAKSGRDKLTFILSPSIRSFGDWVEQLIAESTGKEGKGILPVVGEELLNPENYLNDRVFVQMELEPELFQTKYLAALEAAGHPVIRIKINEKYELGGQFFIWELATAVAGWCLGINPFDQPNVESAKVLAREMVASFKQTGLLPVSSTEAPSIQAMTKFLSGLQGGHNYVALQAYLEPSIEMAQGLHLLRTEIQKRFKVATTVGFGPRFLHSTGQLHKGDSGNGFFIQFISEPREDAIIPDNFVNPAGDLTFGILEQAQALGDAQALKNNQRRVIRFNLGEDPISEIKKLMSG
jgi:glucose-6-phosphate isomerase